MKIPTKKNHSNFIFKENSTEKIIKKIYPKIPYSFFMEKPNIYDQRYISGIIRSQAIFKPIEYISKKKLLSDEIKKIHSENLMNNTGISSSDANTTESSWKTVISGKRVMGQFSVDSLYSPELHAILELPNISCKIFPKENNNFLYIIVLYRTDDIKGENYANRFIELYNKKRELMESLANESHETKVIKSELAIAEEMGNILSYLPSEIEGYMKKLNQSLLRISSNQT